MIPPDTLQTIKERADVVAVVGAEVRLKRAGTLYEGLCPFHQEKSPSFKVNPHQNTYHCFGCGEHGDSLTFIQKYNSLSFPDAVRTLATLVGVEIVEEERGTPEQQRARRAAQDRETRLAELHAELVTHYCTSLERSLQARQYLQERGISEDSAKAFQLGWASDDVGLFYEWMRRVGASVDDLVEIGAIKQHDPEDEPERVARGDARLNGGALRFRNRLMCPVFDSKGRAIGFSGRIIHAHSKAPKYLNTPETPLFRKGRSLYGLKTAREVCRSTAGAEAPLIVCEGNLDVVSMWQAGFKKIVAPMGTALTPDQAQLMSRLTHTVICVMDGDKAGQKAAFKSLPILLSAGLRVRAVVLPAEEDPDSFVRAYGPQEMQRLLDAAPPLLLVYLKSRLEASPRDTFGQAQVVREVLPLVSMISDTYERPLFLDEVARAVGVDRHYLTRQLDELMRASERGAPSADPPPVGALEPQGVRAPREGAREGAREILGSEQGRAPHSARGRTEPSQWWVEEAEKLKRLESRRQGRSTARPVSVTGQIEINAPESPAPFVRLDVGARARQLIGFEREALSLLYYQPELLAPFIERGGLDDLSHPLVAEFVRALYRVYSSTGYVGDDGLLARALQTPSPHSALASEIQDCLARRPLGLSAEDLTRQLINVQRCLRQVKLSGALKGAIERLQRLERDAVSAGRDALQEARERVLSATQALNAFHKRPHDPSKAS